MIGTTLELALWHRFGEMPNSTFGTTLRERLNGFGPLFLILIVHVHTHIPHPAVNPQLIRLSLKTLALGVPVRPMCIINRQVNNQGDDCNLAQCCQVLQWAVVQLPIHGTYLISVRNQLGTKNTVGGGLVPAVSSADSGRNTCCYGESQYNIR